MGAVHGVVVVGDFLRPDGAGAPGGVDAAVAWLFDATRRQIALASGLPLELLTPHACADLADWVGSLRPPQAADAFWAAMHASLPHSEALERLVLARLRGRFCVTYEAPPYLVGLLDRAGIPYLDVRLHPVRFLDDLIFAVRASEPATQAALFALALPESLVHATAGLREAMCRFISAATVPTGTLLVLGQRPVDATQIVGGAFFDALQRRDEILRICSDYRGVLLKPHPSGDPHSLLLVAATAARVIGATADNLYRLLSLPQIAAVLTVNSSAAYEAGYFDKRIHCLAPLPIHVGWRDADAAPDLHVSLDDIVLAPDFWRHVLAPHTSVTAADGMRLPPSRTGCASRSTASGTFRRSTPIGCLAPAARRRAPPEPRDQPRIPGACAPAGAAARSCTGLRARSSLLCCAE